MDSLRIVFADDTLARYQGGGHWMVFLQYLLGLKDLGHEVYFLELVCSTGDPQLDRKRIANFLDRMRLYDLEKQCIILFFDNDNPEQDFKLAKVIGRSREEAKQIFKNSDLFWKCCRGASQTLLGMFKNRVFIDLDPGHLHLAPPVGLDFDQYQTFFSVGKKLHDPDCKVPTFGLKWHTFYPFIYLPMWTVTPDPGDTAPFSSITHWTWGKELSFENRVISFSKRDAYLRYLELPQYCNRRIQLAAYILPTDTTGDRELLEKHGWELTQPWEVAATPDEYQSYIAKCRAEISCPKPVFRELKTGWFSDRSACFLASGRPVLAEDTGFSEYLPTGEGLLTFHNITEAVEGIKEIDANYLRHMQTAREIAEEYLDSRKILSAMLEKCF